MPNRLSLSLNDNVRDAIRRASQAVIAVVAFFALQAAFDYQERVFADRAAYRKWVADNCMPTSENGNRIARIEGGLLHCEGHENVGYGRAPVLAFHVTAEVPE